MSRTCAQNVSFNYKWTQLPSANLYLTSVLPMLLLATVITCLAIGPWQNVDAHSYKTPAVFVPSVMQDSPIRKCPSYPSLSLSISTKNRNSTSVHEYCQRLFKTCRAVYNVFVACSFFDFAEDGEQITVPQASVQKCLSQGSFEPDVEQEAQEEP